MKGEELVGWIATGPTRTKKNISASALMSHVTIGLKIRTLVWQSVMQAGVEEPEAKQVIWDKFVNGPAPVGYDPSMIPGWESAASENFAGLRLDPWRLRVMPGSVMLAGSGETLVWEDNND